MAKVPIDQYANRALAAVTMSAANTITFEQIRFAVGTFQGVALLIHRLEWHPSWSSIKELTAATDYIRMALTTNDNLTTIDAEDQDVLATYHLYGLGANVELVHRPLITSFEGLPGGGIICPANPLYIGMLTAGAAAASDMRVVVYYTFKQLSDKDYLELLQSMVPGNI
jgi:hypothetical protein